MYPDRKKTVLVVDDDPDNLDLIQEQVSLLIDCSIITASDGSTALALAKEFRPHLILLDIWLVGLDGFQVVQQLKLDSRTQSIPVIAVTATAHLQEQVIASEVGFADYVRKPYDLETLKASIDRCLEEPLALKIRNMTGGYHCN